MTSKNADYKSVLVDKLIPYARNSRTHSEQQVTQLAASIKEFGFLNPVIIDGENGIIAGHGRVMAAKKLGLTELPCIEASYLTDAQKRAYVIADNQLALNSEWDIELLAVEIDGLKDDDFNIDIIGFDADELEQFSPEQDSLDDEDNPYSSKTESPVYEPVGDKPEIGAMYDYDYHQKLISEIDASHVSPEEKAFLKLAAGRHVVFNFEQIANYYAHSDSDTQELFENSALIIVDFKKAIEKGFAKLGDDIAQAYISEHGDDNEQA